MNLSAGTIMRTGNWGEARNAEVTYKWLQNKSIEAVNVSEVIYKRLAHHLDSLPGGFPATDSGEQSLFSKA